MNSAYQGVDARYISTVRSHIADHADAWLEQLMQWLRIASISTDPQYRDQVRAGAQWLAEALSQRGVPTVEIIETAGHPAVYEYWPAQDPAAPTVLLYGHHDVQPVVPVELWLNPPFEPTVVDGELRARGAIDDKGQVAFHLLGLSAHLAATGRNAPAVNLKFLIEGEEENGSPHFRQLLTDHADKLSCDVVVVSDTTIFDKDTPSICLSMRGLITGEITASGPTQDLHSGVFGGAVPNPIHALSDLIAHLHDAKGRIAIDGFYDDVVELSELEREKAAKLPFDEERWLRDTAHSRAAQGEAGFDTLARIGARPTVEINGIWGGYTGVGDKTIIPTVAHAKFSFRLVAQQEPTRVERLFREYVAARTPAGVNFEVKITGAVRPAATSVGHPANAALARAMAAAFEKEILYTREGGSGPQADLIEILDAPVIFLGVGAPDDGFHAPNERARLALLHKGAEAAAYLWTELANTLPPNTMPPQAPSPPTVHTVRRLVAQREARR